MTCGLRIGEPLDLDCANEVHGASSWLKVPLGKLDTERMVPIDGDIIALIDHVIGGADWKATPLLKSRLAGGFCLRAPAQAVCAYANICEHCPSFNADASSLPVLVAQHVDATKGTSVSPTEIAEIANRPTHQPGPG